MFQSHYIIAHLLRYALPRRTRNANGGYMCRPSQKLHYGPEFPLKIVRGQGQYFFDENDARYLDTTNNVAHGELLCKLAVISSYTQFSCIYNNFMQEMAMLVLYNACPAWLKPFVFYGWDVSQELT